MTFLECLAECVANKDFVAQWARLRGVTLTGSPMDRAIDEATGNDRHIAKLFIADVADLVWDRLPRNERIGVLSRDV